MVRLIYLIVTLRYRKLVPLMYIIIEWISRIVLAFFKVIETAGGAPPPAAILQIVMVSVIPVVFYLSMHQAEQPAVT